jgi:hypothetical protein
MVLDAASLGFWQSCRRRYLLDKAWRPLRWRPKALYDACLRRAILAIVQQSVSTADAAADARAWFLQAAANPGLDIPTDPYRAAQDWCTMLSTVLPALARAGLPPILKEVPPVPLNSKVTWQPLAHSDGQTLHRWITVDRWDSDDLVRELHGWRVMGDVAITKLPMALHIVIIGQTRNGRRASLWIRAWKHPTMPSLQMRFKGKLPGAFKGWKPYYLEDAKTDPDAWVEQMWQEGAAQDLLRHIQIKLPQEPQRSCVVSDVLLEGLAMQKVVEESTSWQALPMSRNACDAVVPCPFQYVCYTDGLVEIDKLGIYQSRSSTLPRPAAIDPAPAAAG